MFWILIALVLILMVRIVWNAVHFPLSKELGWKYCLLSWLIGPGSWVILPSERRPEAVGFIGGLKEIPLIFKTRSVVSAGETSVTEEILKVRRLTEERDAMAAKADEKEELLKAARSELERLRQETTAPPATDASKVDDPVAIVPPENPNIIKLEISGTPVLVAKPKEPDPASAEAFQKSAAAAKAEARVKLSERPTVLHFLKRYEVVRRWIWNWGWTIPVGYTLLFFLVAAGLSSDGLFMRGLRWLLTFGHPG